jgi:cysteine desulfurase
MNPIYLDYNATSPLLPAVREAMAEVESLPLNASSVHSVGRKAKHYLENARTVLANTFSVWPDEVVFTANGTEANNLALSGITGRKLMVAASEHSSVLEVAKSNPNSSEAVILPVMKDGLLDVAFLEEALQQNPETALVSVMLVNNETGVIQPVREIAALVHRYGGLIHCDAVQAVGKLDFDFTSLGVDMMTVAAHKVGGPIGVGALLVKSDVTLTPQLLGGGQEKRRRAGTENISAIIGFASLLEHLPDLKPLNAYREKIEKEIQSLSPDTIIVAQDTKRVSNTISLITPELSSELQLMHLDLAGICVSAGSACSSGRIEPSHVLQAMGYSKELAGCAIRISMGWGTTELEVTRLLDAWKSLVKKSKAA